MIDRNKAVFLPKSKSWLMRAVGVFLGEEFMTRFWTTYRIPFSKKAVIAYPSNVKDPEDTRYASTIEHEMIHVNDMDTWWKLLKMALLVSLLPLPIIFSGRWFIERHAYLYNILNHGYNVDRIVDSLWDDYAWAWPKPLMRKWFNKKIKEFKER